VVDDERQVEQVANMAQLGSVQRMDARRQWQRRTERDRAEALAGPLERESGVAVADRLLCDDVEHVVERGRGEALSPDRLAQRAAERERQLADRERTVALVNTAQIRRREPLTRDRLQRRAEFRERFLAQREAGGECMAAEAQDRARQALRHQVER